MTALTDERPSMLRCGDTVSVKVGWLGVPQSVKGEVLGLAYHDPIACLVRFPSGVLPIPVVHLERPQGTQPLAGPEEARRDVSR